MFSPIFCPGAETSREGSDCRTNLRNIFTETNMVANASKPMGWNINTCKTCRLIIGAEFMLLFTINLTMSISLANDNCVPY